MGALDEAWLLLKQAVEPRGLIRPIGTYDGKKVVMVSGVPYYQSTGTSYTPGIGRKEAGAWFPFSGIEPQAGAWSALGLNNPAGWWMKGTGLGVDPHGRPEHAVDWSTLTTSPEGQRLARIGDRINPPEMTMRQLNDALIAQGWNVPMRGQYSEGE